MSFTNEPPRQMRANEARATSYEYALGICF